MIISGISTGFNSKHSCFICTGHKSPETGRWVEGPFRTTFTAMVDFNGFEASGSQNRLQKFNHNQVREPMILTRDLHKELVKIFKPDPLHVVKLGKFMGPWA